MSVVRERPAKLVVRHDRSKAGHRRPRRKVLQLPTPAVVADYDIKLTVRTETDDSAIVVSRRVLGFVALPRRCRRPIVLKGTQLYQVLIESK